MTNETLEIIRQRRSVRAFKPEAISRELLEEIAEAGLHAPNAGGQAWHLSVIENKDVLTRVCALSKQAASLSPLPWLAELGNNAHFDPSYGAPVLILISCEDGVTAPYDSAAATENILLAAESLGLASCWVFFPTQAFDIPEGAALRPQLGIPEGYAVLAAVALGYAAETPAPRELKGGLVTYIK